jgi:hypothetical protein
MTLPSTFSNAVVSVAPAAAMNVSAAVVAISAAAAGSNMAWH